MVAGSSTTSTAGSSISAAVYTGGDWDNIGAVIGITKCVANGITDSGLVSCSKGLEVNSYIYNTNTSQYTNLGTQPGVCNGLVNHCGTDTYPFDTVTYETGTPMNSSGEIVGFYNPTSGSAGPNLFVYSGGMNGSTSTVTTPGTGISSITAPVGSTTTAWSWGTTRSA